MKIFGYCALLSSVAFVSAGCKEREFESSSETKRLAGTNVDQGDLLKGNEYCRELVGAAAGTIYATGAKSFSCLQFEDKNRITGYSSGKIEGTYKITGSSVEISYRELTPSAKTEKKTLQIGRSGGFLIWPTGLVYDAGVMDKTLAGKKFCASTNGEPKDCINFSTGMQASIDTEKDTGTVKQPVGYYFQDSDVLLDYLSDQPVRNVVKTVRYKISQEDSVIVSPEGKVLKLISP
jgi:hypothetical protein